MATKTAAELVTSDVRESREHPEYDHIAGVSVMPRIPQPSHPANWRVELSVSGSWHIPEGAYKIVERLQAQFNLACSPQSSGASKPGCVCYINSGNSGIQSTGILQGDCE